MNFNHAVLMDYSGYFYFPQYISVLDLSSLKRNYFIFTFSNFKELFNNKHYHKPIIINDSASIQKYAQPHIVDNLKIIWIWNVSQLVF
jgi:hypothetical protein